MALSIDEYCAAIQAAPPAERRKVVSTLKKRKRNDERSLAAAWVADFICALPDQDWRRYQRPKGFAWSKAVPDQENIEPEGFSDFTPSP